MGKFKTWDADQGDEDDAKEINEASAERAALAFAKKNYFESDYPARQTILIRADGGAFSAFEVFAEETIDFRAEPLEVGSAGTPLRVPR